MMDMDEYNGGESTLHNQPVDNDKPQGRVFPGEKVESGDSGPTLATHDVDKLIPKQPDPCDFNSVPVFDVNQLPENLSRYEPRPFPCVVCCKRFKLAHHLVAHARTHTGVRPYSCDQCGSCFTQLSSMRRHCFTIHRQTVDDLKATKTIPSEDKNTVAAVADIKEDYNHNTAAVKALTVSLPITPPLNSGSGRSRDAWFYPVNQRGRFICMKCEKTFKNKFTVKRHMTICQVTRFFSIGGRPFDSLEMFSNSAPVQLDSDNAANSYERIRLFGDTDAVHFKAMQQIQGDFSTDKVYKNELADVASHAGGDNGGIVIDDEENELDDEFDMNDDNGSERSNRYDINDKSDDSYSRTDDYADDHSSHDNNNCNPYFDPSSSHNTNLDYYDTGECDSLDVRLNENVENSDYTQSNRQVACSGEDDDPMAADDLIERDDIHHYEASNKHGDHGGWNIPEEDFLEYKNTVVTADKFDFGVSKPHRCLECNRRFRLAHHLTNHMATHTGARPFICFSCDSHFSQISSLKRHVVYHCRDSVREQPRKHLACRQCTRFFPTGRQLARHMIVAHSTSAIAAAPSIYPPSFACEKQIALFEDDKPDI